MLLHGASSSARPALASLQPVRRDDGSARRQRGRRILLAADRNAAAEDGVSS